MVDALLSNATLVELPKDLEARLVTAVSAAAAGKSKQTIPADIQREMTAWLKPQVDGKTPIVVPAGHTGLVIPVALQKAILTAR
jgi:hypothetical protein